MKGKYKPINPNKYQGDPTNIVYRSSWELKFIKTKDETIEHWLIEIKPSKFAKEPVPQKRKTKKYINQVKSYAINRYKWDAAKYFCKKRNWKFKVLTEQDLKIKG